VMATFCTQFQCRYAYSVSDPASSQPFRLSNLKTNVRHSLHEEQPLQVPVPPLRLVIPAVNPAASNGKLDPAVLRDAAALFDLLGFHSFQSQRHSRTSDGANDSSHTERRV